MVPIEPWRNSTPDFGAAAFCTTKNDDFRASLTSPLRTLRWPRSSSKREIMKDWAELCHTQYDNQIRLNKIKLNILWRKKTFDGRQPLTEDNLWRKTTFDGRRPLTEDDLWLKTIFDEDDLCWKMTFDGRRPLTENDLWRKTNFNGKRPLMEDDLWWKTTLNGRWP